MKQELLFTTLLLVTGLTLSAQSKFEEIDIFLEQQLKNWHIPNISTLV